MKSFNCVKKKLAQARLEILIIYLMYVYNGWYAIKTNQTKPNLEKSKDASLSDYLHLLYNDYWHGFWVHSWWPCVLWQAVTLWLVNRGIAVRRGRPVSRCVTGRRPRDMRTMRSDLESRQNRESSERYAAWISRTLSRQFSLSFVASSRSSGLHPVSSHSCCMYVLAGRPAFARPYVGVHRSTSLMSSSLLLQQCHACLARLTWIVFVMGGRWPYSWCLVEYCRQDLFNIALNILV